MAGPSTLTCTARSPYTCTPSGAMDPSVVPPTSAEPTIVRTDIEAALPGWRYQPRGFSGTVRSVGQRERSAPSGSTSGAGGNVPVECEVVANVPAWEPEGPDRCSCRSGRRSIPGLRLRASIPMLVGPDRRPPALRACRRLAAPDHISRQLPPLARSDVAAAWPGWGSAHGFSSDIQVDRDGWVCAFGLNAPGTPGGNAARRLPGDRRLTGIRALRRLLTCTVGFPVDLAERMTCDAQLP